jgi:hypothetical protein
MNARQTLLTGGTVGADELLECQAGALEHSLARRAQFALVKDRVALSDLAAAHGATCIVGVTGEKPKFWIPLPGFPINRDARG